VNARYSGGEVLLASLVFTDQDGIKKRPVLVVRDGGDNDLLVLPVTSHAVRSSWDIMLTDWREAGLRLPSVVRTEKLATIAKRTVVLELGKLSASDRSRLRIELPKLFESIMAGWTT
jgi:mRNA interferase MazF